MLNDELLSAYLDGELDETKRALVETWLAGDKGAAMRAERMRGADEMLRRAIPRLAVDGADPVAALITGQSTAANVTQFPRPWARQAAAIAAACLLGVLVGRFAMGAPGEEPMLHLSAGMQRVLDTAVSGETAATAGGQVQLALSLRTDAGGVCRQFRTTDGARSADGVACRDGSQWRLIAQAEAPAAAQDYQTAAATDSPIDAAISALGGSSVLDEREERALIGAHWPTP